MMIFSASKYASGFFMLLVVYSCNRLKEETSETWDETRKEVSEQKKKLLKKGFDAVFGGVSVRQTTFDEEFTDHPGLTVKHIKGVWMDMPAGFYYCFLKYKADKKQVLRFIEQLPTENPGISDKTYTETTNKSLRSNLNLLKTDYPDAFKKVSFFSEVLENKGLLYYKCNRYPNTHTIAFDPKTGTIYHHFERYLD